MALTKSIQHVLEDSGEPLPKRLKVANSIFCSSELPLHHREALLLNWLAKSVDCESDEVVVLLRQWLTSVRVKGLNRGDIGEAEIVTFIQTLSANAQNMKQMKADIKNTYEACLIATIENRIFQQYFKLNVKFYCNFVSKVLTGLSDAGLVINVLKNEQLFNRDLVCQENFTKYFVKIVMKTLASVVSEYPEDCTVFDSACNVVEKCMFFRNFKTFEEYYKRIFDKDESESAVDKTDSPGILFKNLKQFSSSLGQEQLRFLFKITFQAYCNSYKNHFDLIYKHFIIIMSISGFEVSDYFKLVSVPNIANTECNIQTSLSILAEVLAVLTNNGVVLNSSVNDVSFGDCLQSLCTSIFAAFPHPNPTVYKLLKSCLAINPLLAEKIVDNLLFYTMITDNSQHQEEYESFLAVIVEIFSKLHRIQNLTSKLLRVMKMAAEKSAPEVVAGIVFAGSCEDAPKRKMVCEVNKVLPSGVLCSFTNCVVALASWQAINVFKTLLFHLSDAFSTEYTLPKVSPMALLYTQLVSLLTCQFLSSCRIAENTVSLATVEKFVACMEEMRGAISKFATALLAMEHNNDLMITYLDIYNTWGDVYLEVSYYLKENGVELENKTNFILSNFKYLQSGVDDDQWSLITQRITNFGNSKCKQLLHTLTVQRLKASIIFEDTSATDAILPLVIHSFCNSLESLTEDLLSNKFVIDIVVPRVDKDKLLDIANVILFELNRNKSSNIFEAVKAWESNSLLNAVVHAILKELLKHVRSEKGVLSPVPFEVLQNGNREELDAVMRDQISSLCKIVGSKKFSVVQIVDEDEIKRLLALLFSLPTTFASEIVRLDVLLHLLYVALASRDRLDLKIKCETGALGILQSTSFGLTLQQLLRSTAIINNLERYKDIFECILHGIFKEIGNEDELKSLIDPILENIEQPRFLQITVVIANIINEKKKAKSLKFEVAAIETTLYKTLLLVTSKSDENDVTEAWALCLKHALMKQGGELESLLPNLRTHLDRVLKSRRTNKAVPPGGFTLFITVLRNKALLKDVLQDTFVFDLWSRCRFVEATTAKDSEEHSELLVLVFEHVSNNQFKRLVQNHLLTVMYDNFGKQDFGDFEKQLKIWTAAMESQLNPVKLQVWQEGLEALLLKFVTSADEKNCDRIFDSVIKFEVTIVRALHFTPSANLLDLFFQSISKLPKFTTENSDVSFKLCCSLLESLLKHQNASVMDRLPSFLQQYRILVCYLSSANSELSADKFDICRLSDCAHRVEKLTRTLASCDRHMNRLAPYVVAEILKQFEQVTIHPSIKMHLNNCIYSMFTLYDQHSLLYSARILSTASNEMFKMLYENYKKYYKFTGKV